MQAHRQLFPAGGTAFCDLYRLSEDDGLPRGTPRQGGRIRQNTLGQRRFTANLRDVLCGGCGAVFADDSAV